METSGSFLCHPQIAFKWDEKEETLYVETGRDLLLNVEEHGTLEKHQTVSWKFNSKINIGQFAGDARPKPLGNYAGRAELFPQNQSLLLKEAQKTDSGEYKAVFSGDNDITLVKYQVIVLDPVSDVKLEVKQCSSDRSDLTVTCTTLDGLLKRTFICEKTICSLEGGEQTLNIPPGASMNVTRTNDFVTCHHSNQVSFTEDTKTVKEFCGPVMGIGAGAVAPVAVAFILLAVAALVLFCCRKKGKRPEGEKAKHQGDEDLGEVIPLEQEQENGATGF